MMSGVLLAVALYAIVRWKVVVDATLGPAFSNQILLLLGVFSLLVACFSLVIQRNYKRMLAYSSIEHSGLVCIGLGLGPLGVFAALLHLVCHTAAKSMLFVLSGEVSHRYQSTDMERVSGLLKVMPWTGALFMIGILAVIGAPPFGLFISEFALIRAGFADGRPLLTAAIIVLLVVAFVALLHHSNKMLYGPAPQEIGTGDFDKWRLVPLSIGVGVLLILGLTLPLPFKALLDEAVKVAAK
jgi:hydrogenase-4 component F